MFTFWIVLWIVAALTVIAFLVWLSRRWAREGSHWAQQVGVDSARKDHSPSTREDDDEPGRGFQGQSASRPDGLESEIRDLRGRIAILNDSLVRLEGRMSKRIQEHVALQEKVTTIEAGLERILSKSYDVDTGANPLTPAASWGSGRFAPITPRPPTVSDTSRQERLRKVVEEYCRQEAGQEKLLDEASRLGFTWGAVDIESSPPRFKDGRGRVLAIRLNHDGDTLVVVGENCIYGPELSSFFARGSAEMGARVYSSQAAEATLLPDGTLKKTTVGALKLLR